MSETAKDMEVLRGQPINIKIGDKTERVERLSIDTQIEVMDLIQEQGEATNKFAIGRMLKIISISAHREVGKDEFASAAQIVAAFNAIWTQNEFDFLVQEVGKVRLKAE